MTFLYIVKTNQVFSEYTVRYRKEWVQIVEKLLD